MIRLRLGISPAYLPANIVMALASYDVVEIAQLVVLQDAVGVLRQIQMEHATIGAPQANHVALAIELLVERIPLEGMRMQHALHSKAHVGLLEQHRVEQLEGDG